MITVLILMFLGMVIGHFIKNKEKVVKINDKLILYAIFLLLFFLGILVGNNDQIMNNLGSIGIHAFIISIFAILGSIILAYFVGRTFFNKKNESKGIT